MCTYCATVQGWHVAIFKVVSVCINGTESNWSGQQSVNGCLRRSHSLDALSVGPLVQYTDSGMGDVTQSFAIESAVRVSSPGCFIRSIAYFTSLLSIVPVTMVTMFVRCIQAPPSDVATRAFQL